MIFVFGLLLILIVVIFHQVSFWTYFYQTKEYRFDRIRVELGEGGELMQNLLNQFDLTKWYRPKRTARGLATWVCSLLLSVYLVFFSKLSFLPLILLLIPLITLVVMALITPPFYLIKELTIYRAGNKMRSFTGRTIGITGSFGKTSTKEILAHILGKKFRVFKTAANENSEIGVAQAVLRMPQDTEIFVCEMGAYKRGEIRKMAAMVRPEIGIITGLGDQHLALFGSAENLRKAKFELIEALPKNGLRLVADEDFKLSEALNLKVFQDGVEFVWKNTSFRVNLLGRETVRNVIGAIKAAEYLGMNPKEIAASLADFHSEYLFPKLYRTEKTVVIDNSYNNSREAFLSALGYLDSFKGYRKIVVTPGISELGPRAQADHAEVGKKLSAVDRVYLTHRRFYLDLNRHGNVILENNFDRLRKTLVEEADKGKTAFLFQGRVPKILLSALL